MTHTFSAASSATRDKRRAQQSGAGYVGIFILEQQQYLTTNPVEEQSLSASGQRCSTLAVCKRNRNDHAFRIKYAMEQQK